MRECRNISELLELLRHCEKKAAPFLVWSSLPGERKRAFAKASLRGVRLAQKRISLQAVVDKELPGHADTLYFYREEEGALFKALASSATGKIVDLTLAGKFFLREKRQSPRLEFNNAGYFLKIATYKENQEKLKSHEVVLGDIGPGGFAFTSSAQAAERFQTGDKVILFQMEKIKMPEPLLGKVAHVSPLKGNGADLGQSMMMMIGVRFEEPSPLIMEALQAL